MPRILGKTCDNAMNKTCQIDDAHCVQQPAPWTAVREKISG